MPIPQTRNELLNQIHTSFGKLDAEMAQLDSTLATTICVDDWRVQDLLAVRLWWTRSVLNWIDQGRRGKVPAVPAPGYRWSETPRLNNNIVARAHNRTHQAVVKDLRRQYRRLLKTIEVLSDRELLETGVFQWAGSYPLRRWLSINTIRQYDTAATYLRRTRQRSA